MHIARLQARNFRLFPELLLEAHPQLNLIVGGNGEGKTSTLEAFYVLGRGSSYRAASPALVRDGAEAWALEAGLDAGSGAPAQTLRLSWSKHRTHIGYGAEPISVSELVRRLPVQIIDPGTHRLLEEGPGIRRRSLDWGVFHVEHDFLAVWKRAHRALRQRNSALRAGASAQSLDAWDRELVDAAEPLTALRGTHAARLAKETGLLLEELLPGEAWKLEFAPGWDQARSYLDVLQAGRERDRQRGQTLAGPHRAELSFYRQGRAVKGRISRGQQKLLIAAFVLAQCRLVRAATGVAPVLLVDDFTAELSLTFQRRLLSVLEAYPGQKFLAALERSGPLAEVRAARVFHVEHERLRPLALVE